MAYSLTDLSKHKKKLQTEKMNVPAILHLSEELMPNEDTLAEIEAVSASPYGFHHMATLSDVHSKKGRKNPTGTVFASEKFLLPQINDTAPNCGMRFLKTNLQDEDLSEKKLDKLFSELVKVIPTKKLVGTKIPYRLVLDICRKGSAAVKEYFGIRIKNEIENTFRNGNFFSAQGGNISERDILNVIPKLFLEIGRFRLGILGAAGNHFLDLMKISEIKDRVIAQKFGLKEGQYIFLLHTGSGLLGQYASYFYTPKKKEHLSQKIVLEMGKFSFDSQMIKIYDKISKKIAEFKDKNDFFAYEESTLEGEMFIHAHWAAANHGFANRAILANSLDQTIEKVLGKNPEMELLYDMPHVYIDRENHFGKDVWVHRNGTVRANGPKRMEGHPLFSETGEPVFIPSSMSTPAYIGVGTDENESSFFSASHGTGRRKNPGKDTPENKSALRKKMDDKKVKLFNAKSKGVVLQDSDYYKDVEEVISGMVDNKIVKVVAKMEPIAVLMY
jgi:tRNA-splicing ligase RtcB